MKITIKFSARILYFPFFYYFKILNFNNNKKIDTNTILTMYIMTTNYIVKIFKEFEAPVNEFDGFVIIKQPDEFFGPTLLLQTKQDSSDKDNVRILYRYISKDFAEVGLFDNETTVMLTFKDCYTSNRFSYKLVFDKNSKSSYNSFKKELTTLMNTSNRTLYYNSGNEKYLGAISTENDESMMNGSGTLYYDNSNHAVKYSGEFEDNMFDGAGRFQNREGNIVLVANNISNGIPVMKGKLFINFREMKRTIEVNFLEFWTKIGVDTKLNRRTITSSNNFVKIVASQYLENGKENIEKMLFEDKTNEQQNMIIWKRLDILRKEQQSNNDTRDKQHMDLINMLTVMGFIATASLMFNFMLIFK